MYILCRRTKNHFHTNFSLNAGASSYSLCREHLPNFLIFSISFSSICIFRLPAAVCNTNKNDSTTNRWWAGKELFRDVSPRLWNVLPDIYHVYTRSTASQRDAHQFLSAGNRKSEYIRFYWITWLCEHLRFHISSSLHFHLTVLTISVQMNISPALFV